MKTKFNGILTLLLALTVQFVFAQKTVSGTVSDESGALPGVSVMIKGTKTGTETDFNGKYSLQAKQGDVLVFSYVGLETAEKTVGASNVIDVVMVASSENVLDEVVVTALGVKKEKKALGYSSQEVKSDELTNVKQNNFVNSLSGKVSGVQIRTNNNFGGSTNVVMRGNKSLTSSNQVLFVVDGVPLDNSVTNTSQQRAGGTGYDYGNAISDINPNDIESMNVLKGASASALYGARAANGVIVITTKKGKKRDGLGITVNSGVTFGVYDKSTFAEYQNEYGAGYGPYYGSTGYFEDYDVDGDGNLDLVVPTYDDASYGAAFSPNLLVYQWDSFVPESPNYMKKYPYMAAENGPGSFFQTGLTSNNSIDFSKVTENAAYRVGYTYYNTTGILPNSKLAKHNVSFNGNTKFNDKLSSDISFNYSYQDALGRNSTGYNDNLMSTFRQWWQVNVDVKEQERLYHLTKRNVSWNGGAPWAGDDYPLYWDNPYWTRFENYESDSRNRIFGNVGLTYKLMDWASVTTKFSLDKYNDVQEERREIGSVPVRFGILGLTNGQEDASGYMLYNRDYKEYNYDLLFNFNNDFSEKMSFTGLLGGNIRRNTISSVRASTNGGIVVPNLFALSNSTGASPTPSDFYGTKQVNSVFGNATIGYNDLIFLELTDRIDQSSTLPKENNTYNYWSASTSIVFSKLAQAEWLNLGKIRFNYAQVGNDTGLYNITDTYVKLENFGDATLFTVPSTKNNSDLKPEITKSIEGGFELSMFNNRLGLDFAAYKTNTFNQLLPSNITPATGFSSKWVNAGQIDNKGLEISLNAKIVKNDNFTWATNINWSKNISKVVELYNNPATGEPLKNLTLGSFQGGVSINATLGEPYGVLRGTGFQYHENGQRIVNSSGYYVAVSDQIIGNPNPDWIGGINNTLTYKNLSLNFLIDMQQGGDVYSLDMHYGQGTGVVANTVGTNDLGNPIRDPLTSDNTSGGIILEGVNADGTPNTKRVSAGYYGGVFYWGNSSRNPGQLTVYDASYVKLREVALSYKIPNKFIGKYFTDMSISFTGSNLWIISKNVPYADPESGLAAGNTQGYLSGSYPTTKTYGFNIKLVL